MEHPMYSEEDVKELVDKVKKAVKYNSYAAVLEDFEWQDPKFHRITHKKMMVVVWNNPKDRHPEGTDLFAWDAICNGVLTHMSEENGWEKVIEL